MNTESTLYHDDLDGTLNRINETIPAISGKLITKRPNSIFWEYEIGTHIIQLETKVFNSDEGTIVTTSAKKGKRKGSVKPIISKLHKGLHDKRHDKRSEKNEKQKEDSLTIQSKQVKFIILFFAALAFLTYYMEQQNRNTATNNNLTNTDTSGEVYYTRGSFYGTYTREDLNKLLRIMEVGDKYALEEMYKFGKIFFIPSNAKAHLVESTLSGVVKIRLEGRSEEIWTVKEAIEK